MDQGQNQRNPDATCFVGNLDERVDEDILWELFNQMGPVASVYIPKDKASGKHQGYGFVEFRGEDDVEYAVKVLNMIKLYNRTIKVNKASHKENDNREVGANLFIGNLSDEVTATILYDTFSAFGGVVGMPRIMRDEEGNSKGCGFLSFDSFAASDLAIDCMNRQYLCGNVVSVQYSLKKDGSGERYGSDAERAIAASAPPTKFKPHTMFSAGAGDASVIAAPAHTAQVLGGAPIQGIPMYDPQEQYMYPMGSAPYYPPMQPPPMGVIPIPQGQPMGFAPPPPPPPPA